MVFIQTDFPEPVVPAISRWGIEDKSPIMGWPDILFPRAIGNIRSLLLNLELSIISFSETFSLSRLGEHIIRWET